MPELLRKICLAWASRRKKRWTPEQAKRFAIHFANANRSALR